MSHVIYPYTIENDCIMIIRIQSIVLIIDKHDWQTLS